MPNDNKTAIDPVALARFLQHWSIVEKLAAYLVAEAATTERSRTARRITGEGVQHQREGVSSAATSTVAALTGLGAGAATGLVLPLAAASVGATLLPVLGSGLPVIIATVLERYRSRRRSDVGITGDPAFDQLLTRRNALDVVAVWFDSFQRELSSLYVVRSAAVHQGDVRSDELTKANGLLAELLDQLKRGLSEVGPVEAEQLD